MPHKDTYTVRAQVTTGSPITLLQVKAGSSYGFELVRCGISQVADVASEQDSIVIVRKSVAATVTQAVLGGSGGQVFKHDPGAPNPDLSLGTSATGYNASNEGTDSDFIVRDGFNILNGWLYIPYPDERVYVAPGGILAMKFPTAPGASHVWNAHMVVMEV